MPAVLPDLPQTEIAIVEMTNAFRKENGLGAVKPNAALTAAARAFAQYLARTGKFAHGADGRQPADRAEAQGYRYCLVAENLSLNLDSRGFASRRLAGDAVEGWKRSPTHRANLLQAGATDIGVGVVHAPHRDPKFISVQLLGRPEALKVVFRIENRAAGTVIYALGDEQHDLAPRTIVTHTSCDAHRLSFEKAGAAAARFEPRNGDHFIINESPAGAIKVDVTRQ
ncbi:MAG: CAP domain-containing protein [Hyphomicrobiaceae bacterium]|nr:MAG: CAP domain-containing protein [Hyphomicrobiaceae bacterium]